MTRTPPSLWFRAVGLVAALFVLTVFVMIAALFSDPELPINLWLNRYALPLLLGEVVLLLALGFVAMVTDQAKTEPRPAHDEQPTVTPNE